MLAVPSRALVLATTFFGPAVLDGLAAPQLSSTVTFSTTFPFTAGNVRLPAGSYEVRPVCELNQVVQIVSTTGQVAAFFDVKTSRAAEVPARTEVAFNRHGDAYVLKSVWAEGERAGLMVTASHGERVQARKGAASEQRLPAAKKIISPL